MPIRVITPVRETPTTKLLLKIRKPSGQKLTKTISVK